MQGLFNDLWANQDVISVDHIMDITLPVCCSIDFRVAVFLIRGSTDCTFRYWSRRYDIPLLFSFVKITDPFLGFGRSISWKEDGKIPPGHTMTYKDALQVTTNDFLLKLVVPSWVLGLTPRLRKVKLGFEELHVCRYQYPMLLAFSEVIGV